MKIAKSRHLLLASHLQLAALEVIQAALQARALLLVLLLWLLLLLLLLRLLSCNTAPQER